MDVIRIEQSIPTSALAENATRQTRRPSDIKKPVQDVIEAEIKFGISFFRDYLGCKTEDGQLRIIFSARFQKNPHEIHLVSCPLEIDAHSLAPDCQLLLKIKLEAVSIPWKKLERDLGVERKGLLKVSVEGVWFCCATGDTLGSVC